jgi:protocatechuate 3,4-dioxygenase beta subunit
MGIKTKLAVASLIAVAVAVVFWQASSGSGEAAVSRVDRGISDVPAEPAPSEIAATSPAESATTVKVEHFVRGHVRDESGNPVEGAPVFVGAKKDPFGDENPFHVQPGDYYGRALHTDGNGAFEVRFDEPRRVYVWHYSSGHIRPEWMPGRWVETPAEGVDFTTRLLPTATLVVRVNDLSEGRPVKRFECYAAVPGRGSQRIRTEEFVAEHRLVLPETASDHPVQVRLYLGKSLTDTPVNKSLQIAAGDRREVTLAIRGKGRVRGQVVDSGGRSLGGALVYLGGQMKARGDEPFRAFRESRIGNGARSDADGGFELIGEGLKITAWHPDYTSVTVPIEESMRIVLPDRGAIRGRVVDREGNPVAGLRITLDQSESRETDEDGSFAFEKVEAGVRGLLFKDRSRMVGVCVEPGETKEITLNPGIESVRIDVPIDEPVSGGLVGEGDIYLIRLAKGSQRSITVTDIWPGRYRFLGEEGRLGWVEIDGPEARLEFGRGTLTIRAEPGTRVSVIPAGLDRQMRKVHAKLTNRRVGQDGEVTLASLPTGRYDVCVGRREIEVVASVEVNTEGSAIDLP